jgi:hypothetical protein
MALTISQYPLLIAAPMLQDYLVDKDTGAALSGGIVTFYQDDARTVLKNVYYQTGVPGAYTYIPLPNPNTLTSVGTIADNGGNDVIPYYFPYEEDDDTIAQPYYVTVYSANPDGSPAVLQFTRANFPFITTEDNGQGVNQQDLPNFIDNGQFATNIDYGTYPNGTTSIVVAPGGSMGWQYNIGSTDTGTDSVTFTQFLQEPAGVYGNPDYAINLVCSVTNQSVVKDLTYTFINVNRFASTTQFYTFSFEGISNLSGSVNVSFALIKNYGAGGSATTTMVIEQFTLLPGVWSQFSIGFLFGDNSGETIGVGSFVQLAIIVPPNSLFNLSMTNFILTPGIVEFNSYPERPDTGLFGSTLISDTNGDQLYLPVINTPAGLIYDTSTIGLIVPSPVTNPGGNLLLCDGSSYLTTDYSALGIPYSRLQSVLFVPSLNIPLYGTGRTFANTYITNGNTSSIRISTNVSGVEGGTTDGTIPTGFTLATIHMGNSSPTNGYSDGTSNVLVRAMATNAVMKAVDGNTGFTFATGVQAAPNVYGTFNVNANAASTLSGGDYFRYGVAVNPQFYMWFRINGVGADPAPGGTGYQVNLLSTYTAIEVANCIRESISGYQVSSVICTAASTLTPGAYFTFNANSVTYSVYYTIAGVGAAPATNPILVALTGTETAAQVATKTVIAINSYSFAVPDYRGKTLQGIGSGVYDTLGASRFSAISGYFGNQVGTLELTDTSPGSITNPSSFIDAGISANDGVNWFIRY